MGVSTAAEAGSYEEASRTHRWEVPERYNIAADVCDRWPADKPAMVFEDFRGNERRVSWGEQRSLANRAANVLAARGVERGDRVAVCAPASPETAAFFLATWKLGAILLSPSVLYGDEGIRHRVTDCVLAKGHEPSDELAGDIQRFVRGHLSAYAYPRKIEFVDDLPKTLTGKIRWIELRERERGVAG